MFKNVASQKIQLFAFDITTGAPKTGDAANITAYVSKDNGTVTVLGDTSATEMDSTNAKGVYLFDLTQTETNADELTFTAKSSTANVAITPRFISTVPANFTAQSIDSSGRVDVIKVAGATQTAANIGELANRLATLIEAAPGSPSEFRFTADALTRLQTVIGMAAGNMDAQLANIQADTNDIQTRLPAALVSGRMDSSVGAMAAAVLTATAIASDAITDAKVASDVTIASVTGNVGGNVVGSVGSVAAGGIASTSFAAGAITASAIAADAIGASELAADAIAEIQSGLSTLDASGVRAAVGLSSANLDTQLSAIAGYIDTEVASILAAVDTEVGAIKTVTDKLDTTLTAAVGSPGEYQFTADALENGPAGTGGGGGGPSAATIAAAVWDEALSGHSTAGTAGKIVYTNLDATVGTRATQTSVDTVDSVVDAILVDTAEIGAAGAGLTALASASNLATLTGYVDTEVAAIKSKTDNLPASPAATSDIPSAAAIADAVLDEALSGHTTSGSMGKAVSDTDLRGSRTVIRGTVNSGASTTSIPTSAFSPAGASADQFKGRIVVFDNDTATAALRGEATDITASSNSATPTLTVTALSATPASGDSFSVL